MKFKDLSGRRVGNLRVIKRIENKNGKKVLFLVRCLECNKEIPKESRDLTRYKFANGCGKCKIVGEKINGRKQREFIS